MSVKHLSDIFVDGEISINQNIIHNGDTDTNFGFVANDNFAITTAGTERARVTSGGNLGIGTNNPASRLEAYKSGGSQPTASIIKQLSSEAASNLADAIGAYGVINLTAWEIGQPFQWETHSIAKSSTSDAELFQAWYRDELDEGGAVTKKLVLNPFGSNVGIGVSNPTAKLDVLGNAVIGSDLNSATGTWAVAIGNDNTASGLDALATGELTTASGRQAFSGGYDSTASGNASFAVGGGTTASAENAFAACGTTVASGISSAAFGAFSEATATNSFATGGNTRANGESSFSGGVASTAHGLGSVALGLSCNSYQNGSFSGGTVSSALQHSIAWGDNANATAIASQAFGYITTAAASYSMAAGFNNTTGGDASAVFGQQNTFDNTADKSFGSGFFNTLKASESVVFGSFNGFTWNTSTTPSNQFMIGKYLNVPRAGSNGAASISCTIVGKHNGYTNLGNAAFVVGTGTGVGAEANSFTVQHDGNVLMEQIVNKNYSSDTAAAAGGVPVGGIYHNAGDLKIRLT